MVTAVLGEDKYNSIQDINKLTTALKAGQKISSGSQTAFLGRLAGEAALLFSNPITGLKVILGDVAFNKFITSQMGQDILTKGYTFTGETGQKIQNIAPSIGEKTKILYQANKVNQ